MNYKLTITTLFLFAFSCTGNKTNRDLKENNYISQQNTIKIFRSNENDNFFKIVINDKFYYSDSMPSTFSTSPGICIAEIKKEKQDSLKIYLKIDTYDTLFYFNTKGIDSLLLGRKTNNKGFYILTNQQKDGWLSE